MKSRSRGVLCLSARYFDNPWIFWARFKVENHSLLLEAQDFLELGRVADAQLTCHNEERQHSSLGYQTPLSFLEMEEIAPRTLSSD